MIFCRWIYFSLLWMSFECSVYFHKASNSQNSADLCNAIIMNVKLQTNFSFLLVKINLDFICQSVRPFVLNLFWGNAILSAPIEDRSLKFLSSFLSQWTIFKYHWLLGYNLRIKDLYMGLHCWIFLNRTRSNNISPLKSINFI